MDSLKERAEEISEEIKELTRDLSRASTEELKSIIARLHKLHKERKDLESLGIQTTQLRR